MSFLTCETGLQRVAHVRVCVDTISTGSVSASMASFRSDSINRNQAPSIATKQDFLTVNFSDACCHHHKKQQIAWLATIE